MHYVPHLRAHGKGDLVDVVGVLRGGHMPVSWEWKGTGRRSMQSMHAAVQRNCIPQNPQSPCAERRLRSDMMVRKVRGCSQTQ